MSGFSDYVEGLVMGWVNGSAMPSAPTGRYVALFNGDPTDTGTGGVEVTTTIRAAGRVASTYTRAVGVLTSNADVDFGIAAGAATVSHFAIFDTASGGNMLMSGALTGGTQSISVGTGVKFANGTIVLSVD